MTKMYPSWFVFLSSNFLAVMLIMSSNNWFVLWMSFELSLMSFLPLSMINDKSIESMIKYLLVQSGGSALFMLSFLVKENSWMNTTLLISMLMKMGMFPFFQWVPTVISSMNWISSLILITIQKLGPIFVLMKFNQSIIILFLLSSISSIMIGGLLGSNQSLIRPLLGYSSISHSGWISLAIIFNQTLSMIYVMIYFLISTTLFNTLKNNNMNLLISSKLNNLTMLKLYMILLVMAGLPPFSIFFLKMLILLELTKFSLLIFPVMLGTIMSIYFYLMFMIPNLLKNFKLNKNMLTKTSLLPSLLISFSTPMMILL